MLRNATRSGLVQACIQPQDGSKVTNKLAHPSRRCYPSSRMTTEQIVTFLISERDKLNRAIEVLGPPVRRGRPARGTFAVAVRSKRAAEPKRRSFSPSQRRQQAARMKAFWAAKRKAAGKKAKSAVIAPAGKRKRKPMTAAQKKVLSEKMKAAWEKRKQAA
jgi:hypothetical protein